MAFKILENCPLEGMAEYFAANLSPSADDYPEGIVIPIDKPLRWTSTDVVRKVKFQLQKHFNSRKLKVGHAGTLDPLATGVLVICAGKATKLAEQLQAAEKEYVAEIEFGASTSSFDLEQPVEEFFPYEHITRVAVEEALAALTGTHEQVPPVFSAKMVGGLRAYEYARSGEAVELKTSQVTIYSAELLDWRLSSLPRTDAAAPELNPAVRNVHNYHTATMASDGSRPVATVRIRCSKGTYIRSVARDLGLSLGSGAFLLSLRRTRSGNFGVDGR